LVWAFLASSYSRADAPVIEYEIPDDGWVEVPLDFTFPFYGKNYITSFMFANGVVGFLEPDPADWGLCCNGVDLNNYTGSRFNYTIMPFHTDLINMGKGQFYSQGDSTYQKYIWKNLSEYYDDTTDNTFDLTIYPAGNIQMTYEKVDIKNHNVTVGIVGDHSAGEYEQWFYNDVQVNGAVYWDSQGTEAVVIPVGESICSAEPLSSLICNYYPEAYADYIYNQNCAADPLYDVGCTGYWDAYYAQQCSINALYDTQCPGYQQAYLDQQCELDDGYSPSCPNYYLTVVVEEEPVEIYVPPVQIVIPEVIIVSVVVAEVIVLEVQEVAAVEVVEEAPPLDIIEEVEAELEEAIAEEVAENEPSSEVDEEVAEKEVIEEVVVVQAAKVATKEPTKKEKMDAKQKKMRTIIANKLKSLAKEIGEAATLQVQKELQNYIIALLGYNSGFNAGIGLVDSPFYPDEAMYEDKQIPENQRGLRNGLANQILHNKLVDLQWQN